MHLAIWMYQPDAPETALCTPAAEVMVPTPQANRTVIDELNFGGQPIRSVIRLLRLVMLTICCIVARRFHRSFRGRDLSKPRAMLFVT